MRVADAEGITRYIVGVVDVDFPQTQFFDANGDVRGAAAESGCWYIVPERST